MGRFVIWVEDQMGQIHKAFTWVGKASEGIAKAKKEAYEEGIEHADVWAVPVPKYSKYA